MRHSLLPPVFAFSLAIRLSLGLYAIHGATAVSQQPIVSEIVTAPGLAQASNHYVGPLADAISRVDPAQDGWISEVFNEQARSQLNALKQVLLNSLAPTHSAPEIFVPDAVLTIKPINQQVFWENQTFQVSRASSFANLEMSHPTTRLVAYLRLFFDARPSHLELKLFKLHSEPNLIRTRVYVHANGHTDGLRRQLNAEWELSWSRTLKKPLIQSITALSHEQVTTKTPSPSPLYSDVTEDVLGENESYRQQLLVGTDHWRARLTRDLGLDVIGHHGVALADVNGDQLDDLYLCQQGGLPNRLYLRRPDGSLIDQTAQSNTGWLDQSTSALLLDLDNDSDRDLVVCLENQLLFMKNDGEAHFTSAHRVPLPAQTFSLSAADFDLDGDLDIFACGYNPSHHDQQSSPMGEPVPYHDAKNGGRNLLLRNDGDWSFTDATRVTGLDQNNGRFSFAASWEDFDQDGDPDLYVANDYGRNNLYRNQDGHFADVAAQLGVEDMSAGMSTAWGDVNRDGQLDLYVSNMFSAAGNRIAFERQFQPDLDKRARQGFRRHARGNSLFINQGADASFQDLSETMGVTMGRWAWGSRFADFDGDGWEDIVVANGFITTEDTGDL